MSIFNEALSARNDVLIARVEQLEAVLRKVEWTGMRPDYDSIELCCPDPDCHAYAVGRVHEKGCAIGEALRG